jgi:RHS repeat-associated protein
VFVMRAVHSLTPLAAALVAALTPLAASAQASPSDFAYATRYDAERHVTGTIAPDPDGAGSLHYAAVRTTYDDRGNPIRIEKGELSSWQSEAVAPSGWSTWNGSSGFKLFSKAETAYDILDRKTLETNWGSTDGGATWIESGVTQYSYDSFGRLDCTAVRMNPATWGALPTSACTLATTSSTYGPDRITKNVYDAAGQVLKVIKAYGQTTANGLPQLQQDYVTYTYTDNGKQKTLKDANGNLTTYTYDGFDRLVAWAFPSKTATGSSAVCTIGTIAETTDGFGNTVTGPSETRTAGDDCEKYAYDRNGNRAKLMKRDGNVIRYAFDALNRNTIKDIPGGTAADVYYGYDLRGLQTFARFASATGADTIDNKFDGLGQLSSQMTAIGGASRSVSYLYDADGNKVRITHPDGNYWTYDYDGLDRMVAVKENGTTTIATMVYNAAGLESSETRGGVATTFGYDGIGRLSSLSDDLPGGTTGDITTTLSYNYANQLISRTRTNTGYAWPGYVDVSRPYTANGLNQYSTAGGATFAYDANGNLVSDGTTSYTYDVENRMVATTYGNGAALLYDPLGRYYGSIQGSVTKTVLYDGDQRIAEYDGATLSKRNVLGAGEDNPLFWYEGATLSDRRSLQADERGSIVSVVNAAGTQLWINSYDEYGIPWSQNGKYGFTGQIWIPQVGCWYYKARFYCPTIGRFMQTDPIGYKDQNNLYAYVGNDPIDGRDPSGEMGVDTTGWRDNNIKCMIGSGICAVGILYDSNDASGKTKTPRKSSPTLRKEWEKAFGQPWPKDPNTGRNQDVHHRAALADGGSNRLDNIEPKLHSDHVEIHRNAGDFQRWGARGTGGRTTGALGVFGWFSDLLGVLSGRIRTDNFDNYVHDVIGTPSAADQRELRRQMCGSPDKICA